MERLGRFLAGTALMCNGEEGCSYRRIEPTCEGCPALEGRRFDPFIGHVFRLARLMETGIRIDMRDLTEMELVALERVALVKKATGAGE